MTKSKHTPTANKKKLGRPRKYAAAASLQKKVDAYFNSLKPGKDQPRPLPPTLSGLAVFLDFADFSTFKDYEANPDFSHVLKKAKMRIAAAHEEQLFSPGCTGSIFWLKHNCGDMFRESPMQSQYSSGLIVLPEPMTDEDEWHRKHSRH